jgi:LacI family transcriptional regulator
VVLGGFGEEDGYQGFKKVVQLGDMPEFIFAATFPIALGIYRAAEELGMRIPTDVDIICFGRSGMQQFLSPSITYVEQPTTELGAKALELTLTQIRNPDGYRPELITLPTRLVICKTCVPHPTRSQLAEM